MLGEALEMLEITLEKGYNKMARRERITRILIFLVI